MNYFPIAHVPCASKSPSTGSLFSSILVSYSSSGLSKKEEMFAQMSPPPPAAANSLIASS